WGGGGGGGVWGGGHGDRDGDRPRLGGRLPRRNDRRVGDAARRSDAGLPAILLALGGPGIPAAVDLDHHGGHRPHRLDERGAPRPRPGPIAPGARGRPLVAVGPRQRGLHHLAPPPSPRGRPRAGGGYAGDPRGDPRRIGPLVPRARRAATARHLGQYLERRQGRDRDRLVAVGLSGPRNPHHSAVVQPPRRGDS